MDGLDELSEQLRREALEVERQEPELGILLHRTVLAPSVVTFEDAVASTVCYRLLLEPCNGGERRGVDMMETSSSEHRKGPASMFCPHSLRRLIRATMESEGNVLELGHSMSEAVREDALAVCRRDPAMDTVLEVVLFSKGYAALVCHRAAHRLWMAHGVNRRKFTALFLQSQASSVFGLDIHPGAQIGLGVMLDHGTGIVIGETATVGDGCTILHGVTLGGTGKDHGDRHPKVGKNVLIGAGASLLGNIRIGDGAKIGAGSVVLREIPPGATAVGAPAKIIGRASEARPGSVIDETLQSVSLLHKSDSFKSMDTADMTDSSFSSSVGDRVGMEEEEDGVTVQACMCPYREYTRMSHGAPPGTITICTLAKLLRPFGCAHSEIGACIFALDTKNVGYVHMDEFRKNCVQVITKFTKLEPTAVENIMKAYFAAKA